MKNSSDDLADDLVSDINDPLRGDALVNPGIFNLEAIYLPHAVLDVIDAPQVFLRKEIPAVNVHWRLHRQALPEEGYYECRLEIEIDAETGGQPAYRIQLIQAGIFELRYLTPAAIDFTLAVTCPLILLPYARESVGDLSRRAGFAPALLDEIDFDLARAQQAAGNPVAPQPA